MVEQKVGKTQFLYHIHGSSQGCIFFRITQQFSGLNARCCLLNLKNRPQLDQKHPPAPKRIIKGLKDYAKGGGAHIHVSYLKEYF